MYLMKFDTTENYKFSLHCKTTTNYTTPKLLKKFVWMMDEDYIDMFNIYIVINLH
jgi:hypothetical protein